MTTSSRRRFGIHEVCSLSGVDSAVVIEWISWEWLQPADPKLQLFDDEDLSRIILIHELQELFGANRESIPLVLHLLDQLHFLRRQIQTNDLQSPRDGQ